MNRELIAQTKLEFETDPQIWRDYGVDLVDAGAPAASICRRSPIARKVLAGRWEEAYQDWLKAGEFSRGSEETMLAFILSTPVTFHRQAPIPIPDNLPKRVWSEAEYESSLKLLKNVEYWRKCIDSKLKHANKPHMQTKYEFGRLLSENKPEEAEQFYRDNGLDQELMAEHDLALIRTCAQAHGAKAEEERTRATMWFFRRPDGIRQGPISEFDLKALFKKEELSLFSTQVWTDGMKFWETAGFVKAFRPAQSNSIYSGPLPPED